MAKKLKPKKDKKKFKKTKTQNGKANVDLCTICIMTPRPDCRNGSVPVTEKHGGSWLLCPNKKLYEVGNPGWLPPKPKKDKKQEK